MSGLREQLARRFAAVCYAPVVMNLEVHDATRRRCLEIADECLRQMRWTLRSAAEATRKIGPTDKAVPRTTWDLWAHIIETGPIALAPEDWKP